MHTYLISKSWRYGALAAVPFFFLATATAADVRSPGQGNPLDNLPKADASAVPSVRVEIQEKEQDPALQQLLQRRLTPVRFQIGGVKSLPFERVAAEFAKLANHEVSIAQLLQAAEQVTQLYRDEGYPLSFAYVPAQDFLDDIVVIHVVEGYVGTITITGNPGSNAERLRRVASQISQERPLRQAAFDRVATILGLQPGMRINATVKPPVTTDGAAEMVLDVSRTPLSASMSLDNGTADVRGIFSVSANGLAGFGEQIVLSTLLPRGPDHEKYYGLNYAQPLGRRGMLFQASASDYRSRPEDQGLAGGGLNPVYHTKNQRLSANLSYPLLLEGSSALTLAGGAYAVKNLTRYTALELPGSPVFDISSDIRALNLELGWKKFAPASTTQASLALYKGLNAGGARQHNDFPDLPIRDLDFLRTRLALEYSHQFANNLGFAASTTGQHSSDRLPQSEQISFGASAMGRGYPAGEIAGDKGWGLALELSYAFSPKTAYVKRIQPYLQADTARTSRNDSSGRESRLASLGAGVRITDLRHYSFDLGVAQPVGDIPVNADKRSPRLNFSYTYSFE